LDSGKGLVAVDSALWMTQDSYSGKYVFSPMIREGSPCPAGFRLTSSKDWNKLYDNLNTNMQLDELVAPDSVSYYGLNLYILTNTVVPKRTSCKMAGSAPMFNLVTILIAR
jgi:hypothetical protein